MITPSAWFSTWYGKFTKIGTDFECSENKAMEKILKFFTGPTELLLTHLSVTLCDKPGLALSMIDQSHTKMVLLHNIKVCPATH
jgi:hypothetical protein